MSIREKSSFAYQTITTRDGEVKFIGGPAGHSYPVTQELSKDPPIFDENWKIINLKK